MRELMRAAAGICLVCGVVLGSVWAQEGSPYIRVVDADASTVRLDVAVRTLVPDGHSGPIVNLVGAIHIGDRSFYDEMQALLDVHDVVLYEGVGGARVAEPEPEARDEAAELLTERRLRFLAMLAEDIHRREGAYPASGEAIAHSVGGEFGAFIDSELVDGWDRPIVFQGGGSFDAWSFGADGREGGEGFDADLRASEILARPRAVVEGGGAGGLQADLAGALGLVFQLDGIDYSHPHWRNSDLSIGEIQKALGGSGEVSPAGAAQDSGPLNPDAPDSLKAADMLFRTLSGESFLAKASGFLLKMVGSSPSGRAMVKVMLADTLTRAEDLLAAQPGGLADLMKVIIEDRNGAVVRDLRGVVEDEPEIRSVAVFYGAGHFGDLERRIEDELGYTYRSTLWVPAMTIDLKEAGLSAAQVGFFRKMMRDMLDSQLKALKQK